MDQRDETKLTVKQVLEGEASPLGVSQDVARKAYADRFGSTLPQSGAVPSGGPTASIGWLVATAMGGALAGTLLSSGDGNVLEQFIMLEVMGSRGGMGSLLTSNLMGVLPNSMEAVKVLFLIFLIGFATRTKVWNVIYPKRLPAGLLVARWLGVIAIMCGVARFLCNLFFVFSLISGIGSPRPFGPRDGEFLFGVSMIIDQLWWLSFWLTTFTLVAFMSGMLLQRRFQPQPQRR